MTFKDKPKHPGAKPFSRYARSKTDSKSAAPKRERTFEAKGDKAETGEAKGERIAKVLARAGVASRRDIERMIMEGRVKLNGKVLESPAITVTPNDKIEVDDMPVRGVERTRLWLYHKTAGLVTTNSDPEGRPTVFDRLPGDLPRVMSIGRLDINTEGLLLLTNDGGLSRVLELPTTGWLRRYRVRAHGEIKQDALDKLKDGIAVDGVLYGAIDATLDRTQGSNVWITMGLREGKNREIKNVLGALGLEVNRLIRISYGPFQLGDLPEGEVVEVRSRMLRDQLGPRLIDDAKANFEAPLYHDHGSAQAEEDLPKAGAEQRNARFEKPADKRERALNRLDTKRPDRKGDERGDKRYDDKRNDDKRKDDKKSAKPLLGGRRSANVWMAPGARPLGEKAAAKAAKNERTAQRRGEPDRNAKANLDRFDDDDLRVKVNHVHEDGDHWIRSSDIVRKPKEGEDGRKRSFGDRPPRGDKPFGDKPRGERSFGDKPRGERSFGDKPRGDRKPRAEGEERSRSFGDRPPRGDKPFGDKPRGERSFGDKKFGDKKFGDKPRGERSFGDKPRGERSFGDKPRGDRKPRAEGEERSRSFGERAPRSDKPFDDKPRGERSFGDKKFGDKPRGERSFGDKPRGERSFGDKPRGDRKFGDKPFGGKPRGEGRPRTDGDDAPRTKDFGTEGRSERPRSAKPFGGKPAGKSFGGKPSGSKNFSGKPKGDRPNGGKPAGGPSRGGKGMTRGADRRR